jgi:hypothetical protein
VRGLSSCLQHGLVGLAVEGMKDSGTKRPRTWMIQGIHYCAPQPFDWPIVLSYERADAKGCQPEGERNVQLERKGKRL